MPRIHTTLLTLLLCCAITRPAAALWSDTLSGCWSMNEAAGTTRKDLTGHFDAADSGTVGSVTGVLGNAASFSGSTSQKLQTTAGMTTNLAFNAAHSIAFWIRPTNFTTLSTINRWIVSDTALTGYYFQFFVAMPAKTLEADNASGFGCVNASTTVLVVNTTYHVALTDNGGASGCKLYINGSLDNTVNSSFPSESEALTFTWGLNRGNTNNPWYGWIDEGMTFTSALSSGDITTLYNSGAGQPCPGTRGNRTRATISHHHVPQPWYAILDVLLPPITRAALR